MSNTEYNNKSIHTIKETQSLLQTNLPVAKYSLVCQKSPGSSLKVMMQIHGTAACTSHAKYAPQPLESSISSFHLGKLEAASFVEIIVLSQAKTKPMSDKVSNKVRQHNTMSSAKRKSRRFGSPSWKFEKRNADLSTNVRA